MSERHFLPDVGKHLPRGFQQPGRAPGGGAHESGEELLDQRAPQGLGRLGMHHLFAGASDGQVAALFVKADAQLGQLRVAQQSEKARVGQPLGRLGVEGGGAVGEDEAAVVGQALSGAECDLRQALGVQALDRVAADLGDGDGHGAALVPENGPDATPGG